MEFSGYKRRKLNGFEYPSIPITDQDIVEYETLNDPFSRKLVPFVAEISSEALKADMFRAESVTCIDQDNEQFVRSYHPTLSIRERVWVCTSSFGEPVWVIDIPITGLETVHAGGRPIHYYPADWMEYIPRGILTPRSPEKYNAHFDRYINPRRFLRPADLDSIRELFPEAVGAEVFIAGFIIVLFSKPQCVQDAYSEIWPLELAGLRVFFDVVQYTATTTPIESGFGVSYRASEPYLRAGCLGLKVQLNNGFTGITTVTHGFVHLPGKSRSTDTMQLFRSVLDKAKTSMRRYLPARVTNDDSSFVRSKGRLTNSPLEKEVWLIDTNRKIGTITRTYDRPSLTKPYPFGYNHDLSLITADALPDVYSPPGYPPVTGWAEYSAALDGQEVFTVCHHTLVGRWRDMRGTLDSTLFKRATALGTGYIWNTKDSTQSAFILWHTGDELSPADGWSGAPLCLGRPSDEAAKVVVFQNFQRQCRLAGQGPSDAIFKGAIIKAGFLLPLELKTSTILQGETENKKPPFGTLPTGNKAGELDNPRRSFSAI
ncbi:hypothetical protein BJX99DRAFT_19516 [Aspergillus californicus]